MADELILSISGEDRDLGDRNVPFTENYTINCNQEVDITVTETLDSVIQIRSYTAQANTEQQAVIEMTGLSQGEHTLTITATADGASVTRTLAFTLPITYLSPLDADLGDKGDRFTIPYMAKTFSGAELQITEKLDGRIHREYTAVSGEAQEMTINTEKLVDIEHEVEIIATGDGETKSATAKFRVAPIALSDGGSVQELQDADGNAVYPATIAKAVMTSDGKSVEQELYDRDDKVGDIKTTTRTDLGDEWLLCNGVRVSREVYEKLGELIPVNLLDEWTISQKIKDEISSSTQTYVSCITYTNGYWVVGGMHSASGITYDGFVAYTTDISGEWTSKTIWTGGNYAYVPIKCITYADGYWVAGGQRHVSNNYQGAIAYASDLEGNWTVKAIQSGSGVNDIAYADGHWVACLGNAQIAYTTDITGTWTTRNVWASGVGNCVTYTNGYWVVGGGELATTYTAKIAYTTDLAAAWNSVELWPGAKSYGWVNCVAYADGYWVACGLGQNHAMLGYAADISGTWSVTELWTVTNEGANGVAYADGYWVVVGPCDGTKARIAYTEDLEGTWVSGDLWAGTGVTLKCVTYVDNLWVVGGTYTSDNSQFSSRVASYDTRNILLPTISVDGAYVYIKVKE